MSKNATVYALVDPRAMGVVRYVGSTVSLYRRLIGHLRHSQNQGLRQWIEELSLEGVEPTMRVLQRVPVASRWRVEKKYIDRHYSPLLFNRYVPKIGLVNKPAPRPIVEPDLGPVYALGGISYRRRTTSERVYTEKLSKAGKWYVTGWCPRA